MRLDHAHAADEPCTCTIKSLPTDQWAEAARDAIAINPFNAPPQRAMELAHEKDLFEDFLAVVTTKYWGRRGVRLTVGFLDGGPADLRARILLQMNAWGRFSNVSFVEDNAAPQVRITRGPGGYWSNLGTDILRVPAGTPTMNLQGFTMNISESEFVRVVRHETGHTLGFPHEHKRPELVSRIDSEKAIVYFMSTQNWTREQVIQQVLTPLVNSSLIATNSPDPNSIMCYWLPASIMKDGIAVPGGPDIDAQDAEFAASIYPPTPYKQIYPASGVGGGIGGFDLRRPQDLGFAFDGDSSGKLDHVVFYRPGNGAISVAKRQPEGGFAPIYYQPEPGAGIAGFDLARGQDLGFALDAESSGKSDHVVFYRPGAGAVSVAKKGADGSFTPVYYQPEPGGGIGGFDLRRPQDKGFALDALSTGKLDHVVFYRPGNGAISIARMQPDHSFKAIYYQPEPGSGIGGFDLASTADKGFAFDYDSSGKLDHVVFYRPGRGAISIAKRAPDGSFKSVYYQIDPGGGIGGFDLKSPLDDGFALDFNRSGKLDHLVFYRPGSGAILISHAEPGGTFKTVYYEIDPGAGIGECDLRSPLDRGFALDYDSSGKRDHLVFYRPGSSEVRILRRI